MDKYEELYSLAKEVFTEEQNRFNSIDQKAAQYLSVVTILLGVAGFFAQWITERLLPPNGVLEWLLFSLGIILILLLAITWFVIFSVLRKHALWKIPLDDGMIEFFDKYVLIDIHYTLSKGIKEALAKNRMTNDEKVKRLSYGYRLIGVTVIILLLFAFLFGYYKWQNQEIERRPALPENNKPESPTKNSAPDNPSTSSNPPSTKPNPNLVPPIFSQVNQSYDPARPDYNSKPFRIRAFDEIESSQSENES